ncbi:MAG: M24 family metallopeptidase [Actinomycetota bacterium]
MTAYMVYGSSVGDPDVRHEVAEPVTDPVVFIEHEGGRVIVAPPFERAVFSRREDIFDEVWTYTDLGAEQLVGEESFPEALMGPELTLRALRRAGLSSVVVPPGLPVAVADHLRASGIEVTPDAETAWERRRRKTPWELEGIERAQRAADTAMLAAGRMVRSAEPTADGHLRFEGEILTAELVREAMASDLLAQGAEADVILVQSGDACLTGHDEGRGPILPDRTCVVDCFPRDRRTGMHTDMTRTFVPGAASEEVERMHRHCRAALDVAFEEIRPGSDKAFAKVTEYFHSLGYPTQVHDGSETPLRKGFIHSLGHGVGLEVHERPSLGRRSDELRAGDVVAVEPGLYFEGVGCVRLEDTVLVTDGGVEHLTDPFSYDLEP